MEPRGIQWAFEGTGSVGYARMVPPTSGRSDGVNREAAPGRQAVGRVNVKEVR
jgi:hypothetical protein